MKKIKVGLDYHGVIDTFPEFYSALSQALVAAGHEVHIITGPRPSSEFKSKLMGFGIKYTHFFSIVEYHENLGTPIEWKEDSRPYMDLTLWDKTKAIYCAENQIDLHIDNSTEYGKYFTTPYALLTYKQ